MPPVSLNIKAEEEFNAVCNPKDKCKDLDDFLAQIFAFRIRYDIYREELEK